MVPPPSQQAQPAPSAILDPHEKRPLKILESVIAPRSDFGRNGVHALPVEVEKFSLADLDLRQESASQFRLGAFAIVAHIPSGTRANRGEGCIEGCPQRQIVRRLPLPPCPSRGLFIRRGTAEELALLRSFFNVRSLPIAKTDHNTADATIH